MKRDCCVALLSSRQAFIESAMRSERLAVVGSKRDREGALCKVKSIDMHNARDGRRTWLRLTPELMAEYIQWANKYAGAKKESDI